MIRCNNCYRTWGSEEDLPMLQDADGHYTGCPDCNTDGYLMDVNAEAESEENHD